MIQRAVDDDAVVFVVVQLLRTTGCHRVRRFVASGGAPWVICLDLLNT